MAEPLPTDGEISKEMLSLLRSINEKLEAEKDQNKSAGMRERGPCDFRWLDYVKPSTQFSA